MRTCRYCRGKFRPKRDDQVFCTADHRKRYWQYGALPFDKLIARVERNLRAIVAGELAPLADRLAVLENATHPAVLRQTADAR